MKKEAEKFILLTEEVIGEMISEMNKGLPFDEIGSMDDKELKQMRSFCKLVSEFEKYLITHAESVDQINDKLDKLIERQNTMVKKQTTKKEA